MMDTNFGSELNFFSTTSTNSSQISTTSTSDTDLFTFTQQSTTESDLNFGNFNFTATNNPTNDTIHKKTHARSDSDAFLGVDSPGAINKDFNFETNTGADSFSVDNSGANNFSFEFNSTNNPTNLSSSSNDLTFSSDGYLNNFEFGGETSGPNDFSEFPVDEFNQFASSNPSLPSAEKLTNSEDDFFTPSSAATYTADPFSPNDSFSTDFANDSFPSGSDGFGSFPAAEPFPSNDAFPTDGFLPDAFATPDAFPIDAFPTDGFSNDAFATDAFSNASFPIDSFPAPTNTIKDFGNSFVDNDFDVAAPSYTPKPQTTVSVAKKTAPTKVFGFDENGKSLHSFDDSIFDEDDDDDFIPTPIASRSARSRQTAAAPVPAASSLEFNNSSWETSSSLSFPEFPSTPSPSPSFVTPATPSIDAAYINNIQKIATAKPGEELASFLTNVFTDIYKTIATVPVNNNLSQIEPLEDIIKKSKIDGGKQCEKCKISNYQYNNSCSFCGHIFTRITKQDIWSDNSYSKKLFLQAVHLPEVTPTHLNPLQPVPIGQAQPSSRPIIDMLSPSTDTGATGSNLSLTPSRVNDKSTPPRSPAQTPMPVTPTQTKSTPAVNSPTLTDFDLNFFGEVRVKPAAGADKAKEKAKTNNMSDFDNFLLGFDTATKLGEPSANTSMAAINEKIAKAAKKDTKKSKDTFDSDNFHNNKKLMDIINKIPDLTFMSSKVLVVPASKYNFGQVSS